MRKRVTTRMVGQAAGVSAGTVSRVLNHDPRISRATAEEVIRVARELGYSFLPKSGRRTIGVLLPRYVMDCHTSNMLHAVTNAILDRGFRAEIIPDDDLELFETRVIAGAVALVGDEGLNERWLGSKSAPLVRFGMPGNHLEGIYTVTSDGPTDMKQVVDFLYALGHRRIGCLTLHSRRFEERLVGRRIPGFKQAMERRGLPSSAILYEEDGSLEERLERMLKREKVTALIALPGNFALEVFRALQLAGIRIPGDLSLVAWEFPGVLEFLTPPCTVLCPDFATYAEKSLDLLELLTAGKIPAGDILVPSRFIERQSTAPPPLPR